jgi:hypothetical protein
MEDGKEENINFNETEKYNLVEEKIKEFKFEKEIVNKNLERARILLQKEQNEQKRKNRLILDNFEGKKNFSLKNRSLVTF